MGIKEDVLAAGLARADELEGCTQEQIETLTRALGRPLPRAYEEFLLAMGHRAGRFLRGTDTFWRHLSWLRKEADDLLRQDSAPPLPESAFVFYMHQGYEFGFFDLGAGDDPPTYLYVEKWRAPRPAASSFSDYLAKQLQYHAAHSSR